MSQDYDRIIKMSLRALELGGISPERFRARYHVLFCTVLLTPALSHVMSFAYDELTFEHVTDWIVKIFLLVHVFLKYSTLVVNRGVIMNFIADVNKFWRFDSEKFSEEFILKTSTILRNLRWIIIGLQAYAALSALLMIYGGPGMGFRVAISHVPRIIPEYIGNYLDWVTCIILLMAVIGFNLILLTFVTLLRVQFLVLNEHFAVNDMAVLGERSRLETVTRLVEHHSFLLSQCKKLEDIFGTMLLAYIWNEVVFNCCCLYILVVSVEFWSRVRQVMMMGYTIMELLVIYFLPCQLLSEETAKLPNKIYSSNWMEWRELSSAKMMLIVMQRAQQETIVSAGKFIPMNLETCKAIFKTTFSLYTFLQKVKHGRH